MSPDVLRQARIADLQNVNRKIERVLERQRELAAELADLEGTRREITHDLETEAP